MPPAPLAIACGFALYDEDTTAHGMHKHIQTRTHTPCAVSISPSAGRKGAAAGGTASVSVRQQEQALMHSVSRQMQRAHAISQLYGHGSYAWIAVT